MPAIALPAGFLDRPFAHRGLHDRNKTCSENSLAALEAACAAGCGIELDVQLSADGVAMMFHDATLERLTNAQGAVADLTAAQLGQLTLTPCGTPIPRLDEALRRVAGRVPVMVEIKDQTGRMTGSDGRMETAIIAALQGYTGPIAAMSFNPDHIACLLARGFDRPVGLVTGGFWGPIFNHIPTTRRAELAAITPGLRLPVSFLSHFHQELDDPVLTTARAQGLDLLCWTTHTPEQAHKARSLADQVTFEGEIPG